MQSTGQGAMQSSHPVHSAAMTACIRFGPPAIASTGHASMHNVQPMQSASSMCARTGAPAVPNAGSSGAAGRPVILAIAPIVASPPGPQRLSASPSAIYCA